MHLQVIQDIATPHNNVLLAQLKKTKGITLTLWYCQPKPGKYGWNADLTNAIQPAKLYNPSRVDFKFIWYVLKNPRHKILLVGWSNPSTRALFALLCLLRRHFGMWFDMPQDSAPRSKMQTHLRDFFYALLRTSNATVFAVGQMAVDYFKARKFWATQLVNLPIMVEVARFKPMPPDRRSSIRARHGVGKNEVLLVTGSRLIFDKGFDLVISAMAALPPAQRKRFRCVIIGQGEEMDNLKSLAKKHGVQRQVFLPGWMAVEDFQALISAGDVFIHPARFDAWGSTIFAHALGVPVIGSTGAGSAFDRIRHGKNGWLFNPAKTAELSKLLANLLTLKPDELKKISAAARQTAEEWTPAMGVKILLHELGGK